MDFTPVGMTREAAQKYFAHFGVDITNQPTIEELEAQQTNNHTKGKSGMTTEQQYREEYAEDLRIHQQLGVSVEQYIEQRMIEDGDIPEPSLMPAEVVAPNAETDSGEEEGLWPESVRAAMN